MHSSLEAVGLTAAFATELTRHGLSANVVAGYYHDHVFVDADDAERAVAVLQTLSERHRQGPAPNPTRRRGLIRGTLQDLQDHPTRCNAAY